MNERKRGKHKKRQVPLVRWRRGQMLPLALQPNAHGSNPVFFLGRKKVHHEANLKMCSYSWLARWFCQKPFSQAVRKVTLLRKRSKCVAHNCSVSGDDCQVSTCKDCLPHLCSSTFLLAHVCSLPQCFRFPMVACRRNALAFQWLLVAARVFRCC